jgi:hypothetical protein
MSTSVFQIIRGDNIVANVSKPSEITAALQGAEPGRYVVEESSMAGEFLPSGFTCQRWGVAIRRANDTVVLEPEPAPVKR